MRTSNRAKASISRQAIRYVVVGASNVVIDLLLLTGAVWITGIHKGPLLVLLSSLSFSCAIVNSYIWNGRWTFSSRLQPKTQFVPFAVVSIIGLALNDAILATLIAGPTRWLSPSPVLRVDEVKLLAVAVTAGWNFFAYRAIVFREPPRTGWTYPWPKATFLPALARRKESPHSPACREP